MDVQRRLLLSGIAFRAALRGLAAKGGGVRPEEKMELHRAVEEWAWSAPDAMVAAVEGRDVDDGVDGLPALEAEVARLVDEAVARRR